MILASLDAARESLQGRAASRAVDRHSRGTVALFAAKISLVSSGCVSVSLEFLAAAVTDNTHPAAPPSRVVFLIRSPCLAALAIAKEVPRFAEARLTLVNFFFLAALGAIDFDVWHPAPLHGFVKPR
jgi:hypothetical protein